MMQDALPAIQDHPQTNLFFRDDTLFGVCEGIGEEFGFNANFLRVPFAAGILWNPVAIVGIYLGLGAALALARWIYPKPLGAIAPLVVADHAARPAADNADADELPIAA
jgi:phage shock protein PspC (stress-responsive transcriptional regulator)